MATPTCSVTIQLNEPDGDPVVAAHIIAQLSTPEVFEGVIVPAEVVGHTDSSGVCTLDLFPNELGQVGSRYTVTIKRIGVPARQLYAVIPDEPTCNLHDHLVNRGTPIAAITAPVTSVNGRTGRVAISAVDILMDESSATTVAEAIAEAANGGSFESLGGFPADNERLNSELEANAAAALDALRHGSGDLVRHAQALGVPNDPPGTPDAQRTDCQPLLQAIIDDLYQKAVDADASAVLYGVGSYGVKSPVILRDRVSLIFNGPSEGRLERLPGFKGKGALVSRPITGRTVGPMIQLIHNLRIDGNLVGCISNGVAKVTNGSDVLTEVNVPGLPTVPGGYVVKATGLRFPSYVLSHVGSSMQISSPAQYSNFNASDATLDQRKLIVFKGQRTTGSGTAGTYFLTVADPSLIDAGWRAFGQNLEQDGDDLSQWTRVVGKVGNVVEIDRPIGLTGGSYELLFWEEPDGLYIENGDTAPGYLSSLSYCAVHLDRFYSRRNAGNGITHRNNRNGSYYGRGRCDGNMGTGISNGTSDLRENHLSSGANFGPSLEHRSGATFKGSGEFYAQIDPGSPAILIKGVPEATVLDCDVTGSIYVIGPNPAGPNADPLPIISIALNNLKWSKKCKHPDPTFECAPLKVKNTRLAFHSGGIKCEPGSFPRWIFWRDPTSAAGNGTCEIFDILLETQLGQPLTLFTEAVTNTLEALTLRVINPTTGRMEIVNAGGIALSTAGAASIAAAAGLTLGDEVTMQGLVKYVDGTNIGYPSLTSGGTYVIPGRQMMTNVRNGVALSSQTFQLPAPAAVGVTRVGIVALAGVTSFTVTATGGLTVNNPHASLQPGIPVYFAIRPANTQWYPSA